MNKIVKYSLLLALFISVFNLFSGTAGGMDTVVELSGLDVAVEAAAVQQVEDTTKVIYPVEKTQITNFKDLNEKHPIDLRMPTNIKTEAVYDYKTNMYQIRTKVGDDEWTTPFLLTPEEYQQYTLKKSMAEYFKGKNDETFQKGSTLDDYLLKDVNIDIGPLERIFGKGGVKVRPQGYAEFSVGLRRTTRDDPTISERNRTRTQFEVNEKIQLSANASIGEKMNFDLNYDTEATFDFDSKKLKLAYEGKEDEIVRYLEAGNVSLNTTNSLVQGASSLFGVRADLQFGKLKINTVISQQESESQSVSSKGGVQSTPFEFKADAYDENRHFFLGHYFRDNYDEALSTLPFIKSDISITKIEVWITNKRGNFDQARNIVAFADLAETDAIGDKLLWSRTGSGDYPYNHANNLYSTMVGLTSIRDINQVNATLQSQGLTSGLSYEKIESARLLSSSEYTYNAQLGYISLNSSLQSDEVLAVAYEYTRQGETYQVGEFASNISSGSTGTITSADDASSTSTLFLKLLKPVSLSPNSYSWDLMMKNVYALGGYNLQSDKFRLIVSYQSDTTGTYINYIPENNVKDKQLLWLMNLDRLDSRQNERPNGDGIFDFVEGYTVKSSDGRIIFPVVEPFGSHLETQLKKMTGDPNVAEKYIYQELYDSTLTVARQIAEKNKFRISGSYKASNNNEISLNAMNVARGSVRVTAGGMTLTEGTHYTVDYSTGSVTIIDQSIIDAGTPVNVSLENQAFYSMQRKTLLGLNLSYDFSKDFNIGATFMHMYEKPLTVKTEVGNESVKNTLWGMNLSYRTQSQWLTNLIDKLPFVEATAPSQIALNAEFAHMIPGHYQNKHTGGYSYLDDFESSRMATSVRDAYGWTLASTPNDPALFPEATKSNDIEYGKNRALLAWYTVDDLFTRKNSTLTPSHIKSDREQLSNHFVRRVYSEELYPNRQAAYQEAATIPVLNLSFYPQQRGPYNVVADVESNGNLREPYKRWGGISRKMNVKDFEANNYEYIEFWLMDPFVYNDTATVTKNDGGYLYFNLGEISEDVLKDGRKFYENGLPPDGNAWDPTVVDSTVWGKVPKRQSTVYGFDDDRGADARRRQDVGLNGLNTEEEKGYPTYQKYLDDFRARLDADAESRLLADPFSPFNDPAGDNYHHYRGSDYDREEKSILERYKHYNGTEGNSIEGTESYSTAARRLPDVEDIDQDYTLNETESFFQYQVVLKPDSMQVGYNHINDIREAPVTLANGNSTTIKWYQFKVPIRQPDKRVGTISDYKSIRYMRMFLTGFEKETHLRFGTLDLVRGDWRTYTRSLDTEIELDGGTLNVFTVNIEENSNKEPVSYVLPPGVSRAVDPGQPQLRQENEQALAMKLLDLEPGASRAIYKNTMYDLRRYKRIQMFTHAEALIGSENDLKANEMTAFIRLGSDYKNNYYEYEIPLKVTSSGKYNSNNPSDRLAVWPADNMFDFPLELLKDVKLNRNKEKRKGGSTVSYVTLYQEKDPDKPLNTVSVIGNPSLSDINVIMIGVRNNSRTRKSGEVWINELRLTDFDEEGGWAAQGNLNVALSDIGTINISGRKETSGFGSIEQSLMERRADDYHTYSIAATLDVGRFIPAQAKATIPVYYAYSNETTTPKYDPLDQDVTLDESLSLVSTTAEKDSIKNLAQTKTVTKSFSVSGLKFDIRSKTPMPYDPANITLGYAQSITESSDPTTAYDVTKEYKASLNYSYTPMAKPWKPFANSQSKAPIAKFTKALEFNYLPNNIAFNSLISRYYTETSIRDLESYTLGGDNSNMNFLSWSQDFYWDRDFSLTWDFTRNLKASIQTGTRAEIVEPTSQAINKSLNPEYYEVWKDSVRQSIKNLGDPLSYRQVVSVTYNLPFSNLFFMDWANSSVKYNSNYEWKRGARTSSEYEVGNTITNNMEISTANRLNLVTLYNKSPFLKKVNQKFGSSSASRPQTPARPERPKRFQQEVALQPDTITTLNHNLNIKNIRVRARRLDGKSYSLKYKRVDNNTINILSQDTVRLNIDVVQGTDPEETTWYKIAQYSARGLMSVRSVTINYSKRTSNNIYGFTPNIGDVFGQGRTDLGLTPGLGFAFGFDGGEDYVRDIKEKGWLLPDEKATMNVNPAIFNDVRRFDAMAQLEPIKGLKIDLKFLHEKTDRTEMRYMYDGIPRTYGGSFKMSTISISSAFESADAKKGYYSDAFENFLANRGIVAERLRQKYNALGTYPYSGFLKGNGLAGYEINYQEGTFDQNSPDVLIPAFLAAYTGKDVDKISMSPFPSLASMLPGWSVSYDGLINIPWVKSTFKSLRLLHAYESIYSIGSYSSHSSWVDAGNGLGFIKDVQRENGATPSSGFDISSVTIAESFNPFFGIESTLNNGMTIRLRYNRKRDLNLNVSSYQIVERLSNDFVIGLGYRINEFNRVIGLSQRGTQGFNNDLTIDANFSHKYVNALIRRIEERFTQATSGSTVSTIKISADYALSRALTLKAYYDRVVNTPIVTTSAYPTTNTNFGLSIRFTLTQ